MLEVKIYNSINEVEKECWDTLTTDNVFMCYNWLKTFEETTTLPLKSYYLMVFDKEKLVGISVCYLEQKTDGASIDDLLLGRLRRTKAFKNISFLPAVICYPRKGFGTHYLISKEINPNHSFIILNELINALENIAAKNNASICFQFVMDHEVDLINALTERGFFRTVSYPLNYIDIKWSSFQDYKKYVFKMYPSMKKSIQREINKNRKAGVVLENLKNIEDHQERLFELVMMNHKKYNNDITIKPNYFHLVRENFGDDAIIFAAIKEEKIIGVCTELRNGKEAYLSSIGIDHYYSRDDLTYFNIMYYEPIKNAIEDHLKRIYYSNSLYEVKSRRGCIIGNTYLFYKPHTKYEINYKLKIWFILHNRWMTQKLSYIKKLKKI